MHISIENVCSQKKFKKIQGIIIIYTGKPNLWNIWRFYNLKATRDKVSHYLTGKNGYNIQIYHMCIDYYAVILFAMHLLYGMTA